MHPCSDPLPEKTTGSESGNTLTVYPEVVVSGNGDPQGHAQAPEPGTVDALLYDLATPIVPGDNPELAAQAMEHARRRLVKGATSVDAMHHRLEARLRGLNGAHGFTPMPAQPSRIDEVRRHGGGLRAEMGISNEPTSPPSYREPIYSTPAKNMKAAQIAQADLAGLQEEDFLQQQ